MSLAADNHGRGSQATPTTAAPLRADYPPGAAARRAASEPLWFCLYLRELPAPCLERRQRWLTELATGLMRFSPAVSLDQENGAVLCEAAASLHLFGGLASLHRRILALPVLAGARVSCSVAPSATAALWLARAGQPVIVPSRATLVARLSGLPLAATGWPASRLRLLSELGIGTIGECLRLPRPGLARRLGAEYLRDLDRACGRAPALPPLFQPRSFFQQHCELPVPASDAMTLAAAADRLLRALCEQLSRRQAAVSVLWWRLHGNHGPGSLLRLALARPGHDHSLLLELFRLRLAALPLPAPVSVLELLAEPVSRPDAGAVDLFGADHGQAADAAALLQRLQARLGSEAVHGLMPVASWRPESAWRYRRELLSPSPAVVAGAAAAGQLPLWLLETPRRLPAAGDLPACQGTLCMESGPQRIETGWWDDADVRRDYYMASNPAGLRLWVFRDLRTNGWYLHGLFG